MSEVPREQFSSFMGKMTGTQRDKKNTPKLSTTCLVRLRGTSEADAQAVPSP